MAYATIGDVFTDVRLITGRDGNTITDSNLLTLANKHYLWIIRELNKIEYINAEISTTNLVASQQEYVLNDPFAASGNIEIMRVEVALDGSNWYVAKKTDMLSHKYPSNNQTYDDYEGFTTSNPGYALFDNSLWLFPFPTVASTSTLKIYQVLRPAGLTATTDVLKFPQDFLTVISSFIKADILQALGRIQESQIAKQEGYQLLERSKQLIEASVQQDLVITPKRNVFNYR